MQDYLLLRNVCLFIILSFLVWKICFVWKKNLKTLSVLWFVAGLFPMLGGAFIMGYTGLIIEPHWFIFSSLGFFMFIGIYILRFKEKYKAAGSLLLIFLILFLSLRTILYQPVWKNEKSYCAHWLRIKPGHPFPSIRLALADLSEQKWLQARDRLEPIVAQGRYPQGEVVYSSLGIAYMNLNDLEKAKRHILTAIEINPAYAVAYNIMGTIFIKENNFEEAERNFLDAVAVNPSLAIAMHNLAEAYILRGEEAKAIEWYTLILKTDPDYTEGGDILVKLAGLHYQGHDDQKAVPLLKDCVRRYPKNKEAYLLLGVIWANYNKLDEATALWKKGRELDPHDPRFEEYIRQADDM